VTPIQGKEILRKSRIGVLRTNLLNHLYHHRGQLSLYLRLLERRFRAVYDPTADENPFACQAMGYNQETGATLLAVGPGWAPPFRILL
jgi:hypothetical protein